MGAGVGGGAEGLEPPPPNLSEAFSKEKAKKNGENENL